MIDICTHSRIYFVICEIYYDWHNIICYDWHSITFVHNLFLEENVHMCALWIGKGVCTNEWAHVKRALPDGK